MKTIKIATLVSAAVVCLTGCYNAERNCKDFKTGKFRAAYTINGQEESTEFSRKDSLQIETFRGKTDTAAVRWINDCEYILQKIHPKNMQEKKAVHIKILTTSQNSYTFEFAIVGDPKKLKGTVTKID